MSKIVEGIAKDLKSIPEKLKAKTGNIDKKKLILMNLPGRKRAVGRVLSPEICMRGYGRKAGESGAFAAAFR